MIPQMVKNGGTVFRVNGRLQIVGDSGTYECHLAQAIPGVLETGHVSYNLVLFPEDEHLQLPVSEVFPPGEKPLRKLERSHVDSPLSETRPLRFERGEPRKAVDDFECQGSLGVLVAIHSYRISAAQ